MQTKVLNYRIIIEPEKQGKKTVQIENEKEEEFEE